MNEHYNMIYAAEIGRMTGLPCRTEYRFHPQRKWRADFAIVEVKLLIEVEGGTWTQGRHTRGKGYQADLEKYNTATVLGWSLLRFTPQQMQVGDHFQYIHDYIKNRKETNE